MAYIDGENLIATVIKAHANFDADNVAQAKWNFLDSGKSDHYAILKSGGTLPEHNTVGKVSQETHVTTIQVWQSYGDDGTTATKLYGYVENVKTQIRNNAKLGDTGGIVQRAFLVSIEEVEEMWLTGGGPTWLKQNVNVQWYEQVTAA